MSADLLGPEGAGILVFVQQFDSAHSKAVVIEIELFGVIDGVADLDPLTDIGGGDLVERTFEADGGVVIDDPFVADEEDLIELGPGEPADEYPAYRGVIAIDGSLPDAGVKFMVIVLLEPESESFVDLLQGNALLEAREKPFTDGPKETFHFPAGRAVIGLRVNEGDTGLGTTSSQEIRRETGTVIDVESLGDSVGQEGLLEDDGQGADSLGGTEGMAHHHTGVIIDDGAEDGLRRAIRGADLGPVHEVRDPEIIDVVHFVGLAHIGPIFMRKPSLLFDHSEQGIVVNRRVAHQIQVPKLFIEFLHRERGVGLALDLNGLEQALIEPSGPASVGAVFGFEGIKALLAVPPEPGLHRGNTDLPETIAWEVVLGLGLFPKVLILSPCGFGKHGADELIAFEGDLFSSLFVHGLVLLCEFFDHRSRMTMKPMINPYKHRPLARLCTPALRTLSQESPREVGQSKGEDFNRTTTGGFWRTKLMDRQCDGIEKTYRRKIDSSSGCSGRPDPSERGDSAPLALNQKR